MYNWAHPVLLGESPHQCNRHEALWKLGLCVLALPEKLGVATRHSSFMQAAVCHQGDAGGPHVPAGDPAALQEHCLCGSQRHPMPSSQSRACLGHF